MARIANYTKEDKSPLTPHIQLRDFKRGIFPDERKGSFVDYNGKSVYFIVQMNDSNFTKEGLLEVAVKNIEGDIALIELYNQGYPYHFTIKKNDLQYLNKNNLEYIKS